METIGAFEAKTHLSALLDRVSKGETITITKHGVPAAMLVPVGREARRRVKADSMTVREMIEEGRRF